MALKNKLLSYFFCLSQAFDQAELLECIRRLVEIDQDWVPHSDSASLYIRPTFISTEVRGAWIAVIISFYNYCIGNLTYISSLLVALPGCEEAIQCLALCDLVSSGLLLQRGQGPLPVGRSKVHSGLERRNRRLQDGRVGWHIMSHLGFWLIVTHWASFS